MWGSGFDQKRAGLEGGVMRGEGGGRGREGVEERVGEGTGRGVKGEGVKGVDTPKLGKVY